MLLDPELLKRTGTFALVSSELTAAVGGGYWIGAGLDKKWNSSPKFAFGLALVGFIYCIWRFYKLSKQWMKPEDKKGIDDGTR